MVTWVSGLVGKQQSLKMEGWWMRAVGDIMGMRDGGE